MSGLILKSGNALNSNVEPMDFAAYKSRVLADGGVIMDEQAVKDAMAFVKTSGISQGEVFSATSARWGVRLLGDKPNRLYSLFGESGDLDAIVGQAGSIFYNQTRHAFPVIEMVKALNAANGLQSKGLTNNAQNFGICTIVKTPVITIPGTYGGSTSFYTAGLSTNTEATLAESSKMSILRMGALRAGSSTLPAEWTHIAINNGGSGDVRTGTLAKGFDKWTSIATLSTDTELKVYDKGLFVKSASSTPAAYKNLALNVGRVRTGNEGAVKYDGALYGDVAEVWCLVNTTEEHMKAVSLRASQLYTD